MNENLKEEKLKKAWNTFPWMPINEAGGHGKIVTKCRSQDFVKFILVARLLISGVDYLEENALTFQIPVYFLYVKKVVNWCNSTITYEPHVQKAIFRISCMQVPRFS